MQLEDKFGADWTCSDTATISLWNAAMDSYLDFSGSPVGDVQSITDPEFLAGPAFCAAMKLLSGMDPSDPSILRNLEDMQAARTGGVEDGHATAVDLLARGEPTAAAFAWDEVLTRRPNDILAHKCSHETWFLVGNGAAMRASTSTALQRLPSSAPCFAVVAAQHGFALEETGDYAEAEGWDRIALDLAPRDCWALHCLAHVFESQNRHNEAMGLLEAKQPIWTKQNLLSAHIWWHLALRLIEMGEITAAMAIFDDTLAHTPASNQFRLTDGTSLLWRLELHGVDVGDRWRLMADKWGKAAQTHQNAYLDLHSAFAFASCPDHAAVSLYFDSLEVAFEGASSEQANTYAEVVLPLVDAIRVFPDDKSKAARLIAPLLPELHRIGGSIVQREIVERSFTSALIATHQPEKVARYLDPKIATHPNTPWILRDRAAASERMGDVAHATLLRRRADAMFAGWS
ncbi:MAG: hypothetical protein ABJL99_22325 [Aliishimia sp.]